MTQKRITVVSLASALAALVSNAHASVQKNAPVPETAPSPELGASVSEPNIFYNLSGDVMGLVAARNADGTVLAQHYSHVSHESHSSHVSHYSSSD